MAEGKTNAQLGLQDSHVLSNVSACLLYVALSMEEHSLKAHSLLIVRFLSIPISIFGWTGRYYLGAEEIQELKQELVLQARNTLMDRALSDVR